ncbi:uncharacterized protein LOC101890023 isoform X2 [Musca domestica]|uniref:Uncharacterized protein LOC101890023 isoform X2 n=1 Tax=Musca domestica TaxID=7370 RepID=A0ABM3ULK9_MUSDO|nr:uncharacterized protein LOC101890023 isoform X2 [Musca domestica]XP_058974400.1 uncharacterized protein LOC101890023 isoform X2 [Musca domestica]
MAEECKLKSLLDEWEFPEMYSVLQENEITINELKHLTNEDLKEIIPVLGKRIRFREKLFLWKEKICPQSNETLSVHSKVGTWLNSPANSKGFNDIAQILRSCGKGRAIVDYYTENNQLLESHRHDIISIILEEVVTSNCILHISDFTLICEQILSLFPNENKDFYFIPRGPRKNPSGRLYDKYHNLKSKRRKVLGRSLSNQINESSEEDEIDEKTLSSLKEILRTDVSKCLSNSCNQTKASEFWVTTFPIRKKDIKAAKSNVVLLNHWPGYKQSFGYVLIKSDFKLLYPDSENLLYSKWEKFINRIIDFFNSNIKDQASREELALCKQLSNKDSVNYMVIKLLNSVIKPTARFKSQDGNVLKKFTISDAQESLTLHVTNLSDYEVKINGLKEKYYASSNTLQPIIIVVGASMLNINQFFIYFDSVLYSLNSYIECVDVTFKIFNVLNLSYPKASEGVWYFIQKFFYNITTPFDKSSPSIISLINYLHEH